MRISCVRKLTFEAGHRIHGHESKCGHLHGHGYEVRLHARGPDLDSLGRVIDFGVLKQRFGRWINANWDHGFLLERSDREAVRALRGLTASDPAKGPVAQRIYELDYPPTAENIARYLLYNVAPQLLRGTGVEVFRVTVWETRNCKATAEL